MSLPLDPGSSLPLDSYGSKGNVSGLVLYEFAPRLVREGRGPEFEAGVNKFQVEKRGGGGGRGA